MKDKNGCEVLVYIGKKYNFNGVVKIKGVYCIPRDGGRIDDVYFPLDITGKCEWRDNQHFRLTEREIRVLEKQKDDV